MQFLNDDFIYEGKKGSKEIQEQVRNKRVEMYQSGKGYKAVSKALGTPASRGQSHYTQMEETWTSGEPSQEWTTDQNDPKSATTTHPGGHRITQNNI